MRDSSGQANQAQPIIPSLDGFRAISIVVVAASHCGLGAIVPGGLGVTIFFFLSGYLITTLLLREVHETGSINIRHFYLRRILRLYPPLIITLVIAYSLEYFGLLEGGISWFGVSAQLFYFANYYQLFFGSSDGIPAGTSVLWSLAVEEHFYLVYPVLLLAFVRFRKLEQLPTFLGVLCAVALLWRLFLTWDLNFDPARTFYASDTRFDSILYGALLALVSPRFKALSSAKPMRLKLRLLTLLGIAGLLLSLVDRGSIFRETGRYTLQGISLMPVFFYAINDHQSRFSRLLNWGPVKLIGVYSYSIYLIHFVVLSLLPRQFTSQTNGLVLLTVVLCGSCVYAFLIDRFIDPRFRRMRKALH